MSPTIGHISVPITNPRQFEMRPYSDYLTKLIDQVSSVGTNIFLVCVLLLLQLMQLIQLITYLILLQHMYNYL